MPNMNERDGENSADLYTLCGSLVEGYKRNDIAIHCHFAVEFGGHPSCGNFCVEIKRDSEFDKRYPVDFASTSNGGARPENGEQYPSVFVDIAEIIERPKNGGFPVLPLMVRLQSLDLCHRIWGYPVKSVASKFFLESFWTTADGERISTNGLIVRSNHKFMHQVVEGGTKRLEEISDKEANFWRNWNLDLKPASGIVRLKIGLHHHFCRVFSEVSADFNLQGLKVYFCPTDFLSDGIKRGHIANYPAEVKLSA